MRGPLKGIVIRVVSAAALAAFVFSCSRETAPRPDADVPVAEVDGARVSLKDLKNEIASRRGLTPSLSARSASGGEVREALRALIDRAIVLSEAERMGVSVTGSEVEKEIERYRADFPQGGLEKALLQAGMDMEGWKAELARSLLSRKAAEAIADSLVTVTEEEVEAAYRRRTGKISRPERIRVRQFLFPSEESARHARRWILEGESPEEIRRRFSAGDVRPTVAELGEVTREDLPPETGAELFLLPEGGASGIVPLEESFSIFQVVRKEAAGEPTLAAASPEIREELRRSRKEEAFRSWLASRQAKAQIRVREEMIDRLSGGGKQ
jgi:parvulin-like peptidyl-prolyl isomerase